MKNPRYLWLLSIYLWAVSSCATVRLAAPQSSVNLTIRWQHTMKIQHDDTNTQFSELGSPIIHHGIVYAASSGGEVVSVQLLTGRLLWKKKLATSFFASPLFIQHDEYILQDILLIGDESGVLWGLSPQNGDTRFQIQTNQNNSIRVQALYNQTSHLIYVLNTKDILFVVDLGSQQIKQILNDPNDETSIRTSFPPILASSDKIFWGTQTGSVLSAGLYGGTIQTLNQTTPKKHNDYIGISDLLLDKNNNQLAFGEAHKQFVIMQIDSQKSSLQGFAVDKLVKHPNLNYFVITSPSGQIIGFDASTNQSFHHQLTNTKMLHPTIMGDIVFVNSSKGMRIFKFPLLNYQSSVLNNQSYSSAPAVDATHRYVVVKSDKGTLTALAIQ